MGKKKNPAAVALGKLAASKRTKEELAEAGRLGGLSKAARRAVRNGSKKLMHPDAGDQSDENVKRHRHEMFVRIGQAEEVLMSAEGGK
jgi:hypothetical protein